MPFPTNSLGQSTNINLVGFRKIINDISRPYLFSIDMPNIDTDSVKMTSFARSTSIPAYKLDVETWEFQGAQRKTVKGATFSSWQVEFLTDQVYSLRSKFLAWMSQAYEPFSNSISSPHSYKYDGIKVNQLSRTGAIVQTYQFIGMFPSECGEIQLGHDKTDFSKFTVTFDYDYFTVAGLDLLEQGLSNPTLTTLSGTGVNEAVPAGLPQNNVLGSFDVYGGQTVSQIPLI